MDADLRHIEARAVVAAGLFCEVGNAGFHKRNCWVTPPEATTLGRTHAAPSPYDVLRMMFFVSGRGRTGRPAFECQP